MRTLTPAAAALITSGLYGIAQLIEIEFTSGTARLSTTGPSITWGGNTWQGAQAIGSIDVIDQQAAEIKGLRFTLNGVSGANLAIAMAEPVQGKTVTIRTVIFDPADWTVADVQTEEVGRMDVMVAQEDALQDMAQPVTATIVATAEGAAIDLLRPRGLLYTDGHQQRLHPGDKGCEYVRDADLEITWPDRTWGR